MTSILPTVNPFTLPIAGHPVFVAEMRQTRRKPPRRYALWSLLWLVLPIVVIVGVSLLLMRDWRTFSGLVQFMLAGVFLFGAYLDVASLLSSVNSVSRDFAQVKMDLLRLTPLHEAGIIAAKHALSLVRTRRLTLVLVGARVGVLAAAVMSDATLLGVGQLLSAGLQLGLVALIFLVFVLEPFWRNEMITSLGIYVAALNRSSLSLLLTAGFSMGVVWVLSLMIVGVASFGLGLMASLLLSNVGYSSLDGSLLFGLWFNMFFLVLLASAIYGFYHLLERWCLRAALRCLKRAE